MNNSTGEMEQFEFTPSTSEIIEITYQLGFFAIGAPLNLHALLKTRQ